MKTLKAVWSIRIGLILLLTLGLSSVLYADEPASPELNRVGIDTVWVLMAAFLVFFMQAGFGMVEAGFIRAKNTCNILTKNFLDYCMASLGFFVFGYVIMFGSVTSGSSNSAPTVFLFEACEQGCRYSVVPRGTAS